MSGVQGESFGMMEGAYFVGKAVILEWMNTDFCLQLSKIEECATGAVYCQIIDKLYPGTFSFQKVNWKAKYDYEYVENYKIL
jgi:RP/EB family microtubule-associated protein